jgi:hypothetical protein
VNAKRGAGTRACRLDTKVGQASACRAVPLHGPGTLRTRQQLLGGMGPILFRRTVRTPSSFPKGKCKFSGLMMTERGEAIPIQR